MVVCWGDAHASIKSSGMDACAGTNYRMCTNVLPFNRKTMIEIEELIIQLCRLLTVNVNMDNVSTDRTREIKYDSKYIAYSNPDGSVDRTFEAKIWVDNNAVFVVSYCLSSSDSLDAVKEKLCKHLLQEIFNYGVMAAKKDMPPPF